MTPTESDRLIEIHVMWGADDAALLRIVELAQQHGLVLYDPQGPDIHSPPGIPRGIAGSESPPGGGSTPRTGGRFPLVVIVVMMLLSVSLWLLGALAARPPGQ